MAFDGIITYGISKELNQLLKGGKIEKIYQPDKSTIILKLHNKSTKFNLLISSENNSSGIYISNENFENPYNPPAFCMLLRKNLQGGFINKIEQFDSDRIIEITVQCKNEMAFPVYLKLIVEIMGRHSNIVLVNMESQKIIDSIKRISIDTNRYRQLIPGLLYKYPPMQNKIPFKNFDEIKNIKFFTENDIMKNISGISPAIARELLNTDDVSARLSKICRDIENLSFKPVVYLDDQKNAVEFHLTELTEYDNGNVLKFDNLSEAIEFYFLNKKNANLKNQRKLPLLKIANSSLEKLLLKKKRLLEDIAIAQDNDKFRIYGEILTVNISNIKAGSRRVELNNFYTNRNITIPLKEALSPAMNAQYYFKKYSKSKRTVKEKNLILEDLYLEIKYMESVITNIINNDNEKDLLMIREELVETGYIRERKVNKFKKKAASYTPLKYLINGEFTVYVGRNNKENDYLTMKFSGKKDLWFHTKDIPGSHVILKMPVDKNIEDLSKELLLNVAGIAAFHSKGRQSENVPVDYVPVRYVKKPAGAKPGMVIFTHNRTLFATPKDPSEL